MIGRLKLYAALVGLFVTTLLATWFGGRMTGAANTKAKQAEGRVKAMKQAEEIENEVEALDVDALKRRSTKWVRNTKR
jgi:alkyl hydroperoxide reductase subunit AhpF